MIPRIPLSFLAALTAAFLQPSAHAATSISWDELCRVWKEGTPSDSSFALDGDGAIRNADNNHGAIIVGEGMALVLDGQGHMLNSTENPAKVFTSRAFENKGTLIISNCAITANFNNAVSWHSFSSGGAIINKTGASLQVAGCSFSYNHMVSCSEGTGGALHGEDGSTMTIDNCSFTENYVDYNMPTPNGPNMGGGAISSAGKVVVTNTVFQNNHVFFLNERPFIMTTARGGAISLQGDQTSLQGDHLVFSNNYAMTMDAQGGALYVNSGGSVHLSNTRFENNHVFGTTHAYGGAIALMIHESSTLVNCVFTGNYSASFDFCQSNGGAVYNAGRFLTLVNCSFYDNYVASATTALAEGGAIYHLWGELNIVADGQDSIFQGNRAHLSPAGTGGVSNAIHAGLGAIINLHAGRGGAVIFHDSLTGQDSILNINPENRYGHPADGAVCFKDGTAIDGFQIELHGGCMSMGTDTAIRGDVKAWQGTTLALEGFTEMDGRYSVHVERPGAGHTVLIRMNDAMAAATEDHPVWTFTEGSSLDAFPGSLEFVLDISQISVPWDELRPFIFSHEGQTGELMESVNGAKSVRLTDADGWSYSIPGSFFDYLSGQEGSVLPPEPGDDTWRAPAAVGGVQGNSLWTAVRSLRSFAETAGTRPGQRLNPSSSTAFWIMATGDYFTQSSQAAAEGYRFHSRGYSCGGSYDFSPFWTAGAAFGQSFGTNDVNNGLGSFDQEAVMVLLQLFRSVQLSGRDSLVLGLQGAYGTTSNKGGASSPDLAGGRLQGSWRERTRLLELQGTWMRQMNRKTRTGLYAGLQYTDSSQNSTAIANEEYAYRLTDGSMNLLEGRLGVEVQRNGTLLGRDAAGYLRAGIAHDLDRRTPHVTVYGASRSWTAGGSKPGRTALQAAAGLQIRLSGNWNAVMNYSLESSKGRLDQNGRIGVTLEF